MKNKKGMEFSINFLVTLIIAVVVFGMGIYFANLIFGESNSITEQKFEDFDKQIEEMACVGSERVCLPIKQKTTDGDKPLYFPLVLENVNPQETTFTITVSPGTYVNPQGVASSNNNAEFDQMAWMPKTRDVTIDAKNKQSFGIAVQNSNSAEDGTYSFTVSIMTSDGDYLSGKTLKFRVKV